MDPVWVDDSNFCCEIGNFLQKYNTTCNSSKKPKLTVTFLHYSLSLNLTKTLFFPLKSLMVGLFNFGGFLKTSIFFNLPIQNLSVLPIIQLTDRQELKVLYLSGWSASKIATRRLCKLCNRTAMLMPVSTDHPLSTQRGVLIASNYWSK